MIFDNEIYETVSLICDLLLLSGQIRDAERVTRDTGNFAESIVL